MTAAIVDLLNGWTLLSVLTLASLWFLGYRMGRHDGWLAGRAALRREQARIEGAREISAEPYTRLSIGPPPAWRTIHVHDPHALFDFDEELHQ